MDFIFLTADTVVRRSRVLRVPTPSLPLGPVDKVHHLSLGRIERFQMIVVVSAVDPICQKGQSISLMTTDWNLKFRFIITSRGEFSNSCRRKRTTLWRNRNEYPCQQFSLLLCRQLQQSIPLMLWSAMRRLTSVSATTRRLPYPSGSAKPRL